MFRALRAGILARRKSLLTCADDGRTKRHFREDLLAKMFELGLMGIEIPEEFGGQGGSFFQSVLAVEEIAAVDPAASVIVDVQNTLVVNALMRWGTDEQKRKYLPRLATRHGRRVRVLGSGIGIGCFRIADSRCANGWRISR